MTDSKLDFEQLLTRYNNGRNYGAARKLALELHISESAVGRWREGALPSEEMLPKLAKIFDVAEQEIIKAINESNATLIKEINRSRGISFSKTPEHALRDSGDNYFVEKLIALKKAYDEKLITKTEYDQKRKELLEKL